MRRLMVSSDLVVFCVVVLRCDVDMGSWDADFCV